MNQEISQSLNWSQIVDSLEIKFAVESRLDFSDAKMTWFSSDGILSSVGSSPTLLDYGSGTGVLGLRLAQKINASALSQADMQDKRYFKDANISFFQVERDKAPETDQQFSIIFMSDVLQHVADEKRLTLVNDLLAKLAPEGKLIIQIYNAQHKEVMENWWKSQFNPDSRIVFMSKPEESNVNISGFSIRRKL